MDIISLDSQLKDRDNNRNRGEIKISKLADVHPDAELAPGVDIGPFCVVGPNAKIGAGTRLINNVNVIGHVSIGCDNVVWPGTCLGGEPQDISYQGTPTQVIVGDRNIIRENVTVNRGSEKEEGYTKIGNDCYFMANSHVGHDCTVGDKVIIGQGSMLGGHCHIHSHAILSGSVAVHHFASIGRFAFVGGVSKVLQDIPPYMLADGLPARCKCTNVVALKRNNFSRETISALNEAFRLLYRGRVNVDNAREVLKSKNLLTPEVFEFLSFLDQSREGRHGRSRHITKAVA
ncbi:MAG: acyl-ACP--UDP-N-acetylglucosamine O-acyltransferase [Pirellulaceae bacterium]